MARVRPGSTLPEPGPKLPVLKAVGEGVHAALDIPSLSVRSAVYLGYIMLHI